MLSNRSLGRDIIKHFTKLQNEINTIKGHYYPTYMKTAKHNMYNLVGVPGKHPVIYMVYTYILFYSIYYDNIYFKILL